ncbi:NAD-dependent epimerase/dehydratase family protein [Parabacteroides goldsteinii]|jgi:nucleoside-diphosphate-sugar epimerase|uniref:NAD-dependent epimerase/dehydratase family protein n=1 Tax=Parabacteroides goldsteinii TaxID=328812 RepID=UPI001D3E30E0|nr:NAD(P)-dependent oxidoreductase [Parabacteroides goldsteinii]MBS6577468.1 NAD(P)-dependent oxidoreductase [Parabacteroides goldsteinii]
MKVVITGGSGFIGTNLLQSLIEKKFEVINIDINPPQNKKHSSFWKKVDITNYTSLEKVLLGCDPDYIVHLAARTDLDGKTLSDYSANTIGVANILKISKECTKLKKIIVTSSMLVCYAGYYPRTQKDYAPTTVYGKSKVVTEKNVWNNPPVCDWAIIRPTSIWGEWFRVPYRSFFDMVLSKRYFHIGHKSCTKTYGYVGNAVYQIESILFSPTENIENKIFYIGDNPATDIEIWANEIASEIHSIKRVPFLFIKIAALIGDLLNLLNINFPMTSFRLKNMTTNNLIDLTETYKIAPNPPYSRIDGVRRTVKWMNIIKI